MLDSTKRGCCYVVNIKRSQKWEKACHKTWWSAVQLKIQYIDKKSTTEATIWYLRSWKLPLFSLCAAGCWSSEDNAPQIWVHPAQVSLRKTLTPCRAPDLYTTSDLPVELVKVVYIKAKLKSPSSPSNTACDCVVVCNCICANVYVCVSMNWTLFCYIKP